MELSGSDTVDLYAVLQSALTQYKVSLPGLFPWIPTAPTTLQPLNERLPTAGKQSTFKLEALYYCISPKLLVSCDSGLKKTLPVAGKVLLSHLDCDVTLFASPVKIQQVSSKA